MTKTDFVTKYYPIAEKAGKKFNINPVVILAQGAHESAWGESYGARVRKNFFGIIASGSPGDYWKGEKNQSTVSGLWFRVYKNAEDSFMDFARLISSKYKSAASLSNDTTAYAKAIAYSPYISETNGDNRPAYELAVRKNSEFIKTLIPFLKKKKLILGIAAVVILIIVLLVVHLNSKK